MVSALVDNGDSLTDDQHSANNARNSQWSYCDLTAKGLKIAFTHVLLMHNMLIHVTLGTISR